MGYEARVNSLVKYTVVDVSDKTSPSVDRELYLKVTIILHDW